MLLRYEPLCLFHFVLQQQAAPFTTFFSGIPLFIYLTVTVLMQVRRLKMYSKIAKRDKTGKTIHQV